MIGWIKSLAISLKGYLAGALFLAFSGLLVALKLKDNELHEFQVKNMEDKFKAEDEQASAIVKTAMNKYNEDK